MVPRGHKTSLQVIDAPKNRERLQAKRDGLFAGEVRRVKTGLGLLAAFLLTIALSVFAQGAELTLIIADPGKRFGTVEIAHPEDGRWTVHCHVVAPYHLLSKGETDDLWIYPDQGLYAERAFSITRVNIIETDVLGETLQGYLSDVEPVMFPYFCATNGGMRTSADFPIRVPEGLVFATSRGIRIGDPAERVFAVQGVPHIYKGVPGLSYCGLTLMLYKGRVSDISIDDWRGACP